MRNTFPKLTILFILIFLWNVYIPIDVYSQTFDFGGYTLLKNYDFGTSTTSTVKNISDLSLNFKPYGVAGTSVINKEWQRYQPFNTTNHVFTSNALELTAQPSRGGIYSGGISSGQIVTKETFYPRNGKTYVFVLRAKIPDGDGLWPAFWLYSPGGTGTTSSEIDIFEFFDSPTQNTYDWTGFDHGSGVGSFYHNIMTNQWVWHPGLDFSAGFHEYILVWKEGDIQKWVDGTHVTGRNFNWFGPDPEVLINLAVGGSINNSPSATGTPWPSRFIVDYFKVYAKEDIPQTTTTIINQQKNGNTWNQLGTFRFTAGSSSSVTIRNTGTNGYVIADAVKFSKSGQPDIILDSENITGSNVAGNWVNSISTPGYIGNQYRHDDNAGKGTKSITFTPNLPVSGDWTVSLFWSASTNRATNVPVDIIHARASSAREFNTGEDEMLNLITKEVEAGEQLLMYPSPLRDKNLVIEFRGEITDHTHIRIFNLAGKEVFMTRISEPTTRIAKNDLQSGLLIIQIESNGKLKASTKLVVE